MTLTDANAALDQRLLAWHAESGASHRLAAISGLGVITATAIAATVIDPEQFRSGRQFAALARSDPAIVFDRRHLETGEIDTSADCFWSVPLPSSDELAQLGAGGAESV